MKPISSFITATVMSAALVLPAINTAANASPIKCGDRPTLIKMLKDRYKEVPVAMGISQKNTEAFEIFASEAGSWTVVMTRATGEACVMAVGHSWQDLPKQLAGTKI